MRDRTLSQRNILQTVKNKICPNESIPCAWFTTFQSWSIDTRYNYDSSKIRSKKCCRTNIFLYKIQEILIFFFNIINPINIILIPFNRLWHCLLESVGRYPKKSIQQNAIACPPKKLNFSKKHFDFGKVIVLTIINLEKLKCLLKACSQ